MKLEDVQNEIDQRWGSSEYTDEYNARPDAQRDAHHAMLHITKALGKIASALDDLDHGDSSGSNVETALADIVICSARVASRWPDQRISLGEAVRNRIESKFPAVPQAREEHDVLSKIDWKVSLSGRSYFFEGDFSGESYAGPDGRWIATIKYDDGAGSTCMRVSNMLTRADAQSFATKGLAEKLAKVLPKASPQAAAECKPESHDPCVVKPGAPKAPDGVTATVQNILQTEAGRSSMRIEWKTTPDGRRGSFRVCNLSGSSYQEPGGTWCAHAYLDHMVHLGRSECASIAGQEGIALTEGHATQERAQEQLILLLDLAFSHTVVDAVRETAASYRKLESLRQVAGAIRDRAASPARTSGVLPMSFEEAIDSMRTRGSRMARPDWNKTFTGETWIEITPRDENGKSPETIYFCKHNTTLSRMPWVALSKDVLANDWVELPSR